jgi:zinc protease
LMLGSVFEITATAKPGVKPEELQKAIDEEMAKLRNQGPTQQELDRARNVSETQIIQKLERLGGFGGVADRLNQYNHFLGDPGYLPKDLERYNRATVADLKRVANEKLQANARAVVYGLPGNKVINDPPQTKAGEEQQAKEGGTAKVAGSMPDEPWRAKAPQSAPASKLSLPVPTNFKLSNGLNVYVMEEHNLPIVAAHLIVLSGSDANPPDVPGLASFTASMLTEGTNRRTAPRIADDAAQIGTAIHSNSTNDFSSVNIDTLTQNVGPALDLLSDVTLNPKFDPAEIDRVRKLRQTQLLQLKDDPVRLGFRAFRKVVYGPGHPYGYLEIGTEKANQSITREQMMKFWQRGYAPGNSALVLSGDISVQDARGLADKYFGSWKGDTNKHLPPPVNTKTTRTIYIVDKPAAPQTFVFAGGIGAPRSTPDYVPIEVMNNALGGLFSSRLNMNLREQHGYTYGAFSVFAYRRGPGIFGAGGSIRTDATAPAVQETFKELDRIRKAPLSPEELKFAKDAFSLSLSGYFETTDFTSNAVGDLFTYDLPLDYYNRLPPQIDAVSAQDVQRVANAYVHPETSVVVAAGDRSKIEPELKKLSIGPVEILDSEGNPVKATAAKAGGAK